MTVIWHLLSNRWNSAITEYALSLARASSLVGLSPVLSCLKDSPAHLRAVRYGLDVRPVPDFRLGALSTILSTDIRPSIVVAYGGPETVLSKLIAMRHRVRAVVRFRGADGDGSVDGSTLKQRLSHSHVDLIIVPSRTLEQALTPKFHSPVEQIALGIDAVRFRPLSVSMPERPELQILGRLDPVKGHEQFFEIFKLFLSSWGGVRPLLHVIGEPANLSLVHLENWIKVHGLEGDVKITPTRLENLVDVMNRASLAVVSSLGSEVICRVAEEYLLCGVPLFVSGVGSLHEFFEDGMADSYRGLDTQGAAAALVASLKKALAEGSEARAVRASKARQSYSLETMGKRLKLILAERSLLTDLQN